MTITVVFTTPHPNGGRRPGWTTIEDCCSLEEAASFFLDNRGKDGIPADAEIETIGRYLS